MFGKLTKSRYNKDIPYVFHAKQQVVAGCDDLVRDWFGETLCSLCNRLKEEEIDPNSVSIFECFDSADVEMPKQAYMSCDGKWREEQGLCEGHQCHGSTVSKANCGFRDRDMVNVVT